MKKQLLQFILCLTSVTVLRAQCVPSCSLYVVNPITFTTIPVAGHNTITSFGSFDDGMSGSLPIGFNFTYFCNTYSQFQVSTNGFMTFDLNNTWNNGCCSGQNLPSSGQPNDLIAMHWNDLNLNQGGYVTYTTVGTSPNQMCIITWTDVARYGQPSQTTSGHIILYETTNEIEIHSVAIDATTGQGTQGLENATGTQGYPVPGRNATNWTATNSAYRFSAGGAPTAPASVSGNTSVCEGEVITLTASSMPGATSYVWSLPQGWTGTSTTSILTATAGASGNVSVAATYTCGTSDGTGYMVNTISAPKITNTSVAPLFICSEATATISGAADFATVYTLQPVGFVGTPPFVVAPQVNTDYWLVAENSAGCLSFNSPTVSVLVKETPVVTVSSGSVCLGGSFDMAPTGAVQYTSSVLFYQVTPSSAGTHTYSVIGTNSTGCISQPAISTVVVLPLPNVTASAEPASICFKETAVLNATGASSYVWSNGATSASAQVTPQGPVIYTVTGMDAGCAKTATVALDVVSCTGISEAGISGTGIAVYPNPSSSEFFVELAEPASMVVYDLLGKIVLEKPATSGIQMINLSGQPSGKYLLKINAEAGQQTRVLIKH